jgi:MFS family permease
VAAQIVGGVGVGAAASLGALLAESIARSETYAGIARTSSTLGAAVVGLPLAFLAVRSGRRTALSLGWALAALGGGILVAAAVTKDLPLLIVGMLLFGSGSATNLQSRYAAADLASPLRRARSLSIVVWSTTIGAVVGPNLAGPGSVVARVLHLPRLAGAFVLSSTFLALAAILLWTWLRPDPLALAQRHEVETETRLVPVGRPAGAGSAGPKGARMTDVFQHLRTSPRAGFAFVAVVLAHTVMGAVMTMTPVTMTNHGSSLTIIGMTISVHVLGMYAFSPLVGWLADRAGRATVVLLGQVIFVCAAAFAGLSNGSVLLVTTGLFLLGLGWSFALVAGSAMLSDATEPALRPAVQGTADTTMNVVAAIGAAVSGPAMAVVGFAGLNLIAGALIVPVVVLAPILLMSRRMYSTRDIPSGLEPPTGSRPRRRRSEHDDAHRCRRLDEGAEDVAGDAADPAHRVHPQRGGTGQRQHDRSGDPGELPAVGTGPARGKEAGGA